MTGTGRACHKATFSSFRSDRNFPGLSPCFGRRTTLTLLLVPPPHKNRSPSFDSRRDTPVPGGILRLSTTSPLPASGCGCVWVSQSGAYRVWQAGLYVPGRWGLGRYACAEAGSQRYNVGVDTPRFPPASLGETLLLNRRVPESICCRGSAASGPSYRPCLCEYLGPQFRRQVSWSQQIDADPKQRLQLFLQTAQIEQRCTG
jgi:hypothetical protein